MKVRLRPSESNNLLDHQVPIQSLSVTREEMNCVTNDSKHTDQSKERALSHGLSGYTKMEMCCDPMT